jgi:hypothetical protein
VKARQTLLAQHLIHALRGDLVGVLQPIADGELRIIRFHHTQLTAWAMIGHHPVRVIERVIASRDEYARG